MANKKYTEQFFTGLMQLERLIVQRAKETPEERNATMFQITALNYIQEHSNIAIGDMAEHLQQSKSSATQLIERLVKLGLVKRIHDKLDRRIIRLVITQRGKEEFLILRKKALDKMHRVMSKIPDKDMRELIRIHADLIETLKKGQYE